MLPDRSKPSDAADYEEVPADAVPVLARPGMYVFVPMREFAKIVLVTDEFCVVHKRSDDTHEVLPWDEVELSRVVPDPAYTARPPRQLHRQRKAK